MSSIPTPSSLSTLPPELLTSILSHLFTKHLLQVSTTCRKIHACADYLVHQRIRRIENLDGHQLVFECSPPSGRPTTPYHHCQHTGTGPIIASKKSVDIVPTTTTTVSGLYSHFTPLPLPTGRSPPLGFLPSPTTTTPQLASAILPFEPGEYFTQLYASSVLAKRVGKIASVLTVFSETFFRIRRSWLREAVGETEGGDGKEGRLLWLDEKENVGLRLRVVEVGVPRGSIVTCGRREMWQGEEEEATCFRVSYEEFVVRTAFLAGVVEGGNEMGELEGVEVLR